MDNVGTGKAEDRIYPNLVKTENSILDNIYEISAGISTSMAVSEDGIAYEWGGTNSLLVATKISQINNVSGEEITVERMELVAAGENTQAISDDKGAVYTKGKNDKGQLITRDNNDREQYTLVGVSGIEIVPEEIVVTVKQTEDIILYLGNSFNLKTDVADSDHFKVKMVDNKIATIVAKENVHNADKTKLEDMEANYVISGQKVGRVVLLVENTQTQEKKNVLVKVVAKGGQVASKVQAGENFTVSLKANGTLWSFGANELGQLGLGDTIKRNVPTQIEMTDVIVEDVSTGKNHTIFLSKEGKVYSFGENTSGQLGIGNTSNRKSPVEVIGENGVALENIIKVVANKNTSFAIDIEGNVYAWGEGYSKVAQKLNLSTNVLDISKSYYVSDEEKVRKLLDNTVLEVEENVIQIAEGEDHTAFLTEEGKVYTIGANVYGQLGDGTTVSNTEEVAVVIKEDGTILDEVSQISAGNKYTVAITEEGNIYTWGINGSYQLGTEEIQESHVAKKKNDIQNVWGIVAGSNHVVTAKEDGYVYTWGAGENGQLGNGKNSGSSEAQLVGKNIVEINKNHLVLEEGDTFKLDAQIAYFNLFQEIKSHITYEADAGRVLCDSTTGEIIALKQGYTTVIARDNISNKIGIVQIDILEAGTRPDGQNITVAPKVITKGSHAIMLKVDGSVWCFGQNEYGQCGNGTTETSDEPVKIIFQEGTKIIDIAAGEEHSMALDSDGNVWTWGRNNYYQLGVSNISYSTSPIKLTNLPKVTKIIAGNYLSMVLTESKEVYSFGLNANGEAGTGAFTNKILPTRAKYMSDVIDIAVGKNHSMLLRSTGEVYTTGSNLYGELAKARTEIRRNNQFEKVETLEEIVRIAAGDSHNVVINKEGNTYTWGSNVYGALGTGDKENKEVPILISEKKVKATAGKTHTILQDAQGNLEVVGTNGEGQLGNGTTNNSTILEKLTTIQDVLDVSAGNTYTIAVKKDGTVWAWGDYNHGDRLKNSKTNSEIPVLVGNDETGFGQNEITLKVGEMADIGANCAYQFNLIKIEENFTEGLSFETLKEEIAQISNDGIVTGNRIGTTWVRATSEEGKQYVVTIKVIGEDSNVAPLLVAGQDFATVLKADGSIWSFGYNSNGELADSTNIAKDIPTRTNVIATYTQIKAGQNFIVALRKDKTVWTSGNNNYGQCGLGNTQSQNKLLQINGLNQVEKIAAGDEFVICLDSYGVVYGWGRNSEGQLGQENKNTNTTKPVKISGVTGRIVDLAAGKGQALFITAKGTVFGFGKILQGELAGISNVVKAQVGENAIYLLTTEGNVYEYTEGNLSRIEAITNAIDISVQAKNKMYQDKEEKVYVWGENASGQLGTQDKIEKATPVSPAQYGDNIYTMTAGINNTYLLQNTGNVFAAGDNTYGALGNSTRKQSDVHTLVGDRQFSLEPKSKIMSVNDVEEIAIEGTGFNVFQEKQKEKTEYEWETSDANIATVIDGVITAKAEGEVTITAIDKITKEKKEVLRVIVPLEKQRIDTITVNNVEAEVAGEMKYKVQIITDDIKATLKVQTKDKTDKISTDNGVSWQENGEFIGEVDVPNKVNEITLLIETENGTRFTYTLQVEKISKDIGLQEITVDGNKAKPISSTRYEIAVEQTAITNEVHAITNNANALVGIDGLKEVLHEQTKVVSTGNELMKEIPIVVIAESGLVQEYTLVLYKASALTEIESITVNEKEATKVAEGKYSITVNQNTELAKIVAIAKSSLAEVSIEQDGFYSKQASKNLILTEDVTNVVIQVKAEGGTTKNYILEIQRQEESALDMVIVNGGVVSKNSNGEYEIYLPDAEETAIVRAISKNPVDYVQIAEFAKEKAESEQTVELPNAKNIYKIKVITEVVVEKEYTLIIRKAQLDTSIKEISVQKGDDIRVAQKITEQEYLVKVPSTYEQVTVNAKTGYVNTKVKIGQGEYFVNQAFSDVVITEETTDVTIVVQSENGAEEREIILHIVKMSSDASLKQVTVDGVEAVLQTDETYLMQLTTLKETVRVEAVTLQDVAKVRIGSNSYQNKKDQKTLIIDSKEIVQIIAVQAEDGSVKNYTLKIVGLPDNTNIKQVTVNGEEAIYQEEANRYEIRQDAIEYKVSVVLEDLLANVQLGEGSLSQGIVTETITKTSEETIVKITVIAQDIREIQDYTLAILEKSNNTAIDTVVVNGKNAKVDADGNYQAFITHDTTNLKVTIAAEDERAITAIGNTTQNARSVTIEEIRTEEVITYQITVTSEKGTTDTKTLTIIRQEGNTVLSNVKIGQTEESLEEVVLQADGTYYKKVERISEICVSARAESSKSKVEIGGQGQEQAVSTKFINLTEEVTQIPIIITAEDGTQKQYLLVIEKKSNNTELESITSEDIQKVERQGESNVYNIYCDEDASSITLVIKAKHDLTGLKGEEDSEYTLKQVTKVVDLSTYTEGGIMLSIQAQAENGEEATYMLNIIKKANLEIKQVQVNSEEISYKDEKYTAKVNVASTAKVTIKADNPLQTITLLQADTQIATATGTLSTTVTLDDEVENYIIRITSHTGNGSQDKELTICKKSQDNSILYIKVDGYGVTKESETRYTATVSGKDNYPLEVKTTNENAKIRLEQGSYQTGILNETITLKDGEIKTFMIIVESENGEDREYQLTVTRVSSSTAIESITIEDKDDLGVKVVTVTNYEESSKTYRVLVSQELTNTNVVVTAEKDFTKIILDDGMQQTKVATLNKELVGLGETKVKIKLTAADGTEEIRYLEIIQLSDEIGIQTLSVNEITLTPNEVGNYETTLTEDIKTANIEVVASSESAWVEIEESKIKAQLEKEINLQNQREVNVPITITSGSGISYTYYLTIHIISNNLEVEYVKTAENNVEKVEDSYTIFVDKDRAEIENEIKTISPYATIKVGDEQAKGSLKFIKTLETMPCQESFEVIAEDGSTKSYIIEYQYKSENNNLLEIYVGGTLITQNADGEYVAEVLDTISQTVVKAVAEDKYAMVKVANSAGNLIEQSTSVTITEEESKVPITVTSQEGTMANYEVIIKQISTNNQLEYIKLNGKTVEEKDGIYKAYIAEELTQAQVEIQAMHEKSIVEKQEIASIHNLSFTVDTTNFNTIVRFKIIAQSGVEQEYELQIEKVSNDNTLKEVWVEGVKIEIEENGEYHAKVPDTVQMPKVKAVANNENAVVRIALTEENKKESTADVSLSTNKTTTVPITVRSQSGITKVTYLYIERISTSTKLDTVMIDGTEITDYNEKTKTYTMIVEKDKTQYELFAMAESNYATLKIGQQEALASITNLVDLEETEDGIEFTLEVIAENEAKEVYTIRIVRKSQNTNLELVEVNDEEVLTDSEDERLYLTMIPKLSVEAKIRVKTENPYAKIQIADEEKLVGDGTCIIQNLDLTVDRITIPVVITAPDGETIKTYNIILYRGSNNTNVVSVIADNTKATLKENSDNIYEVEIGAHLESVKVNITLESDTSKVSIDGKKNLQQIEVEVSVNQEEKQTIKNFTVIAEDGTTKDYTIILKRVSTIFGKVLTQNIEGKHSVEVIVYHTADTNPIRPEEKADSSLTYREEVARILTNSDGSYSIKVEASEEYDIVIQKIGYLTHTITNIKVTDGGSSKIEDINLVAGDVVQTGEIEIDDLVAMNDNLGEIITQANKETMAIYDLNEDGKVDKLDRNILKKNYGKVVETVVWINSNEASVMSLRKANSSFILPMESEYKITSTYGYRTHPTTGECKKHTGIDISGVHHTEILAVADGEVEFAGVQSGFGNCVEIKHIVNGETIYSFYAHLSRIDVEVRDMVKQGDVIGLEGGEPDVDLNPGNSTGHHLHFEIRNTSGYGNDVNPSDYIDF